MRVLITGANGFLGRHVVRAVLDRGHEVRALVRSTSKCDLPTEAEIVVGDLRDRKSLPRIVANMDAVIHLAACVVGDDDTQFVNTVAATESLLDAVLTAGIQRFVLCSSFSIYDWRQPNGVLDESTPLESNLYARDGYAIAKTWQERIVRRYAEQNGWQLTVLRPGFLWGRENIWISGTGHTFGRCHVVFGGQRDLPISYVENCAESFAIALDHPAASGETFNIVDDQAINAWHYEGEALKQTGKRGWRLYVPYWLGITAAEFASGIGRLFLGRTVKLPGLLVPIKFRARFRPLQFTSEKARRVLGWQPRYGFDAAFQRAIENEKSVDSQNSPSGAAAPCKVEAGT